MKDIVAYRIKNARKLKGLTLQEVAHSLSVSKQMVSKYEQGRSIPSSSKLIKLAQLFNLKIDYFFNPLQVDIGEVNFIKKSSFSKKQQNSIQEKVKIDLENYLWIENVLSINSKFKNSIKHLKVSSIEDIEKATLQLRNEWHIGIDPIHNIIQLLEDHTIKVIEVFDVGDEFDGLATYVNKLYPVIVVNGTFSVERKRFTLLHELGHLLLNLTNYNHKEKERYCNLFASEFLFPKTRVVKEFGGKRVQISLHELEEAQKKYGLDIPLIMKRLVDTGILSKDKRIKFNKSLKTNPLLEKYVYISRFQTPENSNRYKQLVYRALSQENISLSKASSLLNLKLEEVKESYSLM